MGTLRLRFQQLRNGLPSLNMAVPALKISTWRTSKKCNITRNRWTSARYGIGWLVDESVWHCWDYRHFKRTCRIYLHEELDMKKLCARWVLRLLTADQKPTCEKISEWCLECFNNNKTDFVHWFITMDETWIRHYTPESEQQWKQWTEAGCSAPKKTRWVLSAGKVMASVLWDAEGILFIDYL
jgi:histone-lysine N-methyltransferase SETMAR